MKTIGILGGVTWVSTTEYYRLINQKINKELGGHHTAEIIIHSLNYQDMYNFLINNDWPQIESMMVTNGQKLKKANADFFAISSNTISKVSKAVARETDLPAIDIFASTSEEIKKKNLGRIALLGTKYTMKDPFFAKEFQLNGIEIEVPKNDEIEALNDIIMNELIKEEFTEASKRIFLNVIDRMRKEQNIEGVILGCTEIPLLLDQNDSELPLFDTTDIHTDYIVKESLSTVM